MTAASLLMGAALWQVDRWLRPELPTLPAQFLHVGGCLAAAAAVYGVAAFFLCRREMGEVMNALLRRPLR